jgi:hypothetical protein
VAAESVLPSCAKSPTNRILLGRRSIASKQRPTNRSATKSMEFKRKQYQKLNANQTCGQRKGDRCDTDDLQKKISWFVVCKKVRQFGRKRTEKCRFIAESVGLVCFKGEPVNVTIEDRELELLYLIQNEPITLDSASRTRSDRLCPCHITQTTI